MELGGALRAGAAQSGPILVPDHRRAAHRAPLRQAVGLRPLRPQIPEDLHHLGDDLPRLLEHHGVPDADVLLVDEVLIVEGSAGDGGPRQAHRLHLHFGSQHPRSAHLDRDVQHPAGLPLRRVLVGHGPPGTFGGASYKDTV